MAFVKLDCGILDSTLWIDRDGRELFITALLMAQPFELKEPAEQLNVRTAEKTGWTIVPGWYGFVEAAGVGIVRRAGLDHETGLAALERLGNPETESRSPDHEGRRLVRVDGGFIVLNFFKYRDRDYTSAERSRRYRERQASRRDVTPSHRDITQAEAEAEAEALGQRLRSSSVGTLSTSYSERANGGVKNASKAEENRRSVASLAASALGRVPNE